MLVYNNLNMPQDKIVDLVGVKQVAAGKYESISIPSPMGSIQPRAFGGCALANAIHAAHLSLPNKRYHIYSALGNFLGPARIDRKIFCYVFPYRETRTFYTCRVDVRQALDDGEERSIMMALIDFQVSEPALLVYSAPPIRRYTHVDDLVEADEHRNNLLKNGTVTEENIENGNKFFRLLGRFFQHRPCPESLWSQNLSGIAKHVKTTQDHLSLTEKSSADWFRLLDTETAKGPAEHFASLALLMDVALAFIPLAHNHQFLEDAAACSSLDFALRFFKKGEELDMGKWHLREMKTINGAEGRTYSEAQIWTEGGDMVASMTQQSIMRAHKGAPTHKL